MGMRIEDFRVLVVLPWHGFPAFIQGFKQFIQKLKRKDMWKKTMKGLLILPALLVFISLHAQDPVKWNFTAKKIADKTYELHMTASVESPWSIYSQQTPDGGW